VSKVVISAAKTFNRASWDRVGLLVTSSNDIVEDIQEMFDWVLSAVKTYLGYLCFILIKIGQDFKLKVRTVSSSDTIH